MLTFELHGITEINFTSHNKGGVLPHYFLGEPCGLQETQTKFCINFWSYN